MAEVIKMPRLSDTMTEGVIAAWHKKGGDTVKKGDVLAEIETDKATMELESYQNGVLLHIGTGDGGKLQVDDLLAILGTEGEDISALLNPSAAPIVAAPEVSTATNIVTTASTSAPSVDASTLEEVVLMPRLSDTMTEGVIASWQKNIGDIVKKGDVIAEIETDKATMELESYKNGKLLFQGAKVGEKIQVNDLLCIIGEEGFDVAATVAALKNNGSVSTVAVAETQETADVIEKAAPAATTQPVVVNEGRIFASPLAKKIAAEKGIDLKYVAGSGDNGRIVKEDIDNFVPSVGKVTEIVAPVVSSTPVVASTPIASAPVTKTPPPATVYGVESYDEVPVSQMRKVIARRLSESLFTAPHFFLTMSIDMDAAIAARIKINETSKSKISFNDLVLKATSIALKQHPKINSSWLGDKIRTNYHVNIGVAVAVEDGLLVPVVRFADTKSLSQINAEVKDFAQKAKDKKLQPADWEGSTFTISNLGMYGIDQFTAIINPPDACILAVGGISQEPVVKNGQVVAGNVMKLTLSCDHRVVDGATGAAFLQTVKSLLEEPVRMLV